MAVPQELTDALALLDTETNEMAEYVRGIQAQISTRMSDADVASVKERLGGLATKLDGIAKDPEQPIPDEPLPEQQSRRHR